MRVIIGLVNPILGLEIPLPIGVLKRKFLGLPIRELPYLGFGKCARPNLPDQVE